MGGRVGEGDLTAEIEMPANDLIERADVRWKNSMKRHHSTYLAKLNLGHACLSDALNKSEQHNFTVEGKLMNEPAGAKIGHFLVRPEYIWNSAQGDGRGGRGRSKMGLLDFFNRTTASQHHASALWKDNDQDEKPTTHRTRSRTRRASPETVATFLAANVSASLTMT